MSLLQEQIAFHLDMCKLYAYAEAHGYVLTRGETGRTIEQQRLYVKTGRSKTMFSEHINRCAEDLNIFINDGGKLRLCSRDEIKPLGDFWESLCPQNRWGGNWRGLIDTGKSVFIDAPHFERQTRGIAP